MDFESGGMGSTVKVFSCGGTGSVHSGKGGKFLKKCILATVKRLGS